MWSALSFSLSYHHCFLFVPLGVRSPSLVTSDYFVSFRRVLTMLNYLLNPLIYLWRDKEIRKIVLPFFSRFITENPSN